MTEEVPVRVPSAALCLSLLAVPAAAQAPRAYRYQPLPLGAVRPSGWIEEQMKKDLRGFVGRLDTLVPALFAEDIYGADRLQKGGRARDLGNIKEGDAEGDEQYRWWNSETQSNWWDGYLRHVVLLDDEAGKDKAREYVRRKLATQDPDGYLGIYPPSLRYRFQGENGELWAKATLYRGLLGWYEATHDDAVWAAVARAVDDVMRHYPAGRSRPFESGNAFNGGVSHGLCFTDVLDRMWQHTRERKYLDYAAFLYEDFSATHQSECDAQLGNILDPRYRLKSHGVHTYEHLRPLSVAAWATGDAKLEEALRVYLGRIDAATTASGGPIGDEWIAGRTAHPAETGYEYCSLQELVDSYAQLLAKSGDPRLADRIERTFYNAAQGSRHPDLPAIAYLKTDDSFEMMGTRNGRAEPGRRQTRYKYSPVHQDVAVCCSPNAGRISPYFVQSMWLAEGDDTLVAALLGPNRLETRVGGTRVRIRQRTEYPYGNSFRFEVETERPLELTLKIRRPEWATGVECSEGHTEEAGFVRVRRRFQSGDHVDVTFGARVRVLTDAPQRRSFAYGALLFARAIPASERRGRSYAPGLDDLYYAPRDGARYAFVERHEAAYRDGRLFVRLRNRDTQAIERVELVPPGRTILRQLAF
ncbi:MAG: glycoside hydrolase family 127 protein [Vicinamibacteria bacterium]